MADEDQHEKDERMIEDAKNAIHDRGGAARYREEQEEAAARKQAHKRRVLEHLEKQEQGMSPKEALEARINARLERQLQQEDKSSYTPAEWDLICKADYQEEQRKRQEHKQKAENGKKHENGNEMV